MTPGLQILGLQKNTGNTNWFSPETGLCKEKYAQLPSAKVDTHWGTLDPNHEDRENVDGCFFFSFSLLQAETADTWENWSAQLVSFLSETGVFFALIHTFF